MGCPGDGRVHSSFFSRKELGKDAYLYAQNRGKKGARPPWPLALWYQCQNWNVLPEEGGYLDQDEELMELIGACVYASQLATKSLREFSKADMDYKDWLFSGSS